MGEGNHKGCPYGGRMGWWSSNPYVGMGGRFPNRPYGKSGLDGDDGWRVRGMDSRAGGNNGGGDSVRDKRREGWVPASARTTGGEGQPQGLPLRVADEGGSSRTRSSVWAGVSRTAPTGGGWVLSYARTGGTPILTFPPEGGRERGEGVRRSRRWRRRRVFRLRCGRGSSL